MQLMLMMRSALGSDQMARRCAVLGTRSFTGLARLQLIQLMLMMRSAWDQIGRSSDCSPLIQLMLMMRGASDSIARS